MKNLSNYESIPLFHEKASVKAFVSPKHSGVSPHWHEHIELFYFFEGEGQYTCNGTTHSVKAGDLIVVNSTQIHALTVPEYISYGCILFYPPFFWDISPDQSVLIENHIQDDPFVQEQCEKIFEEQTEKPDNFDMMIKGLSTILLCHLIRNYSIQDNGSHAHSSEPIHKEHLLFDYIATHYQEDLTSANLAKFCNVTESYFCRFFKKYFGRSPTTYLNEYRVDRAVRQLRSTSDSITKIALENGFNNISYFSKTFKKVMGMTPKQYRNQLVKSKKET